MSCGCGCHLAPRARAWKRTSAPTTDPLPHTVPMPYHLLGTSGERGAQSPRNLGPSRVPSPVAEGPHLTLPKGWPGRYPSLEPHRSAPGHRKVGAERTRGNGKGQELQGPDGQSRLGDRRPCRDDRPPHPAAPPQGQLTPGGAGGSRSPPPGTPSPPAATRGVAKGAVATVRALGAEPLVRPGGVKCGWRGPQAHTSADFPHQVPRSWPQH